MNTIIKIINNRNTLLVTALILGLAIGKADFLKPYTLLVLAIVMVFSTTSFDFKILKDYKYFAKSTLSALLLNYVIFGTIVLGLAYFMVKDQNLWWGYVVIAATPPGVAIVPFSYIFKSDTNYSLIGIIGVYLLSIVLTPLIIELFVQDADINIWQLIKVTLEVILVPILLSRLLIIKRIKPVTEKIRGKVVNWGFAIIIYTVIALNRDVIFSDLKVVLTASFIFFVAMFVAGFVFEKIYKNKKPRDLRISQNLMLTIKSSGFAAGTALSVFGVESALPAAIMAVFVILYLIVASFVFAR